MRLTSALWAQLDQVVIALYERDEPHLLNEFRAAAEHFRVKADGLEEEVDPVAGRRDVTACTSKTVYRKGVLQVSVVELCKVLLPRDASTPHFPSGLIPKGFTSSMSPFLIKSLQYSGSRSATAYSGTDSP